MQMMEISPTEAARKSGGFPVWRNVIGPDNEPTGAKVHHESGQLAVVATSGQVQEVTTKRGRGRLHPDQHILIGRRA